jgi:hypothetical protein
MNHPVGVDIVDKCRPTAQKSRIIDTYRRRVIQKSGPLCTMPPSTVTIVPEV